jgi:hypothetical protein
MKLKAYRMEIMAIISLALIVIIVVYFNFAGPGITCRTPAATVPETAAPPVAVPATAAPPAAVPATAAPEEKAPPAGLEPAPAAPPEEMSHPDPSVQPEGQKERGEDEAEIPDEPTLDEPVLPDLPDNPEAEPARDGDEPHPSAV